jgi:transcriptional regulator with XRE-family HTH domain
MNVGDRLQQARESLKLTLAEAKIQTGIGKSSLSDFENGKREPSLTQLHTLADTYKRTLSFFLEESAVTSEVIRWRKRPQEGAEKIEAVFRRLCERYRNLEVWTGDVRNACLPEASAMFSSWVSTQGTPCSRYSRSLAE